MYFRPYGQTLDRVFPLGLLKNSCAPPLRPLLGFKTYATLLQLPDFCFLPRVRHPRPRRLAKRLCDSFSRQKDGIVPLRMLTSLNPDVVKPPQSSCTGVASSTIRPKDQKFFTAHAYPRGREQFAIDRLRWGTPPPLLSLVGFYPCPDP